MPATRTLTPVLGVGASDSVQASKWRNNVRDGYRCGCPMCEVFVVAQEAMLDEGYEDFLKTKRIVAVPTGKDAAADAIHPILYDFQRDLVRWALKRGRAAIFADCGLGKTLQQIEWARHVGGRVLIVAPLSVAGQTIREAEKINVLVKFVRSAAELGDGISITNYEMVKAFAAANLDGMVLDESSILKSIDGKTRDFLVEHFQHVPYRLCCTATPCPNDIAELANHAAFLGVMSRVEMLAAFFVHDDEGWRLRGHAAQPFYRWLASWSMALRSPADLGYDGSRFILPELRIHDEVVTTEWRKPGELFAGQLKGITDRIDVRRQSVADRVARAAEIANRTEGQVIVWCGLNDEATAITKAIPDAVEVRGSDSLELKTERLMGFAEGRYRVIVTKPKIAGHGMNWQNASTMIFVGLGDSFEQYYQCIRRAWRYGQKNPVDVHIVVTDHETEIVANVRRKEAQSAELTQQIITAARAYEMENLGRVTKQAEDFRDMNYSGEGWQLFQGDCVERSKQLADESIDLSVFSPPFQSLYVYSSSERDMGNAKTPDDFFAHFGFQISELLRITKQGRNCCVHVAQIATTLLNHGFIGLQDFRGRVVQEFIARGWIYHGEVVIDKDPQAQAIRTHAKGLLFVQKNKDSSWLRPALADYILVFRKPGDNIAPVVSDLTNEEWIEWARPIWYGIRESDTLNVHEARADEDDRHICPLQLGVIERCIRLWSNRGETVFSPFAGIGSEGYQALKLGRQFIGVELKPLYAETAVKNLRRALETREQGTLFANGLAANPS